MNVSLMNPSPSSVDAVIAAFQRELRRYFL